MVKIGFIVEGATEKIFIESDSFKQWATQQLIEICHPVVDANGGGNLLPQYLESLIKRVQMSNPDYIVILTDLEHDPTPQAVKDRIGTEHTKLIFIAVKAFEAWFLADSEAFSQWLKIPVSEVYPENTEKMPWDRLGELAKELNQRGTGRVKPKFAQNMTRLISCFEGIFSVAIKDTKEALTKPDRVF